MKFVLSTSFSRTDHLLELAPVADEYGWEALTFSDHIVHPKEISTPYPYTEDGSRRWEAFTEWPDPWVLIGALSSITKRIRFTNNVFVLPIRNPFMAAKQISTAAVVSNNRVTLTIGMGWSSDEFKLMEQPFERRGRRADEMVEVMRKLWTGEWVEHHGEFYDFDTLEMTPAPSEYIPIWVGGISRLALKRAVPAASGHGGRAQGPATGRPGTGGRVSAGARHQLKAQNFQRDIAATMARAPQVVRNIELLEKMRSDSPGIADSRPDARLSVAALDPEDNPALDDWKSLRRT